MKEKELKIFLVALLVVLSVSIILNVVLAKKNVDMFKEITENKSEVAKLKSRVSSINHLYMAAVKSYTNILVSNLSSFLLAWQNSNAKTELYTISKIENIVNTFSMFGTIPVFFVEEEIPNEKELTNFPEVSVMRDYVRFALSIDTNKKIINRIVNHIKDGESLTDSEIAYLKNFKSFLEQARMVMVEPVNTGSQYSKIEDPLYKADKDALNKQLMTLKDITRNLDNLTLKSW
ncbi:MAG: hypothetical protein K6343_02500 [Caldisericaceae bacterium]